MAAIALPLARSARAASSSSPATAAVASVAAAVASGPAAASGSSLIPSRPTPARSLSTSTTGAVSAQQEHPLSPVQRVRRVQRELLANAPSTSSASRTRSLSSTASSDAAAVASSAGAAGAEAAAAAAARTWHPTSRRVGLITRKIGMTSFFLSTGQHVPATVLQVMSNQVAALIQPKLRPGTSLSTSPSSNDSSPADLGAGAGRGIAYTALQVAAFDVESKRGISNTVRGHLLKAGITTPKRVLHEFRVTPDAVLPLGTELSAVHFVPGQYVDVRAITRGKGFQGAMKRHGFHGLRASHGVSISHRSHGSTGQHQDPGRVFPGKKMAGRMGGTAHRTVQNARVLRIDSRDELILVQGQVPGPEGGTVYVTDAKRALIGKAANAFSKGKLRSGALAQGNEDATEYLPEGVDDLPFPAGTKEMARSMPEVVELGPVKRAAAAAASS
ncbi:hypothetical protein OC835_006749 [Tilletia horrida]|nr:hypothetical protein OC835_006749 [Tilletia horrida]